MHIDELIRLFPRLYHMAEDGSWPGIQKHGLLSTSALLDLYEVNGTDRIAIESERRFESVTLTHPTHGEAVVRDQKPLREGPLEKCLIGLTLREWYEMLNARVFFWLTEARLLRLLSAVPYRSLRHDVLILDTRDLVEKYIDRIALTPINTGSTLYNPRPRGRDTFSLVSDYPFEERRRARGVSDAVAELVVLRGVPDIRDVAIRVEKRRGSTILETIWERY